jgi:hypothetical protein
MTTWPGLRQAIRDGERSGLHIEHGEADADLWCCATAPPAVTPAVCLARAHQRPGSAHADTGLWNDVVRPGARPR